MKKIASLFQRNYEGNRKVRDEVVPGSEWVLAGEGIATRKWDGLAIRIDDLGKVSVRYDAKAGRTPPANFVPLQDAPDEKTGHWPGWVPLEGGFEKYIREAMDRYRLDTDEVIPAGTYEVCGPKIGTRHGSNPEGLPHHVMVRHGATVLNDCPRSFEGLMDYLKDKAIEGIVWHHPDGRMVKIKKADFP